jgi:TetR/AcrR family transcriptional regulator, transcriptional repressor for nem operon
MATTPQTTDSILDAAQRITQSVGYNGLSFRDIAKAVGIKSASVHYHFPAKADLGAAVARRYTDRLIDHLVKVDQRDDDAQTALSAYVAMIRATLEQDGRMCLCGMLAAETDAVPPQVRAEVRRFVDLNVAWLGTTIARSAGKSPEDPAIRHRALSAFAALEGAMLISRGLEDITVYDAIAAELAQSGPLHV